MLVNYYENKKSNSNKLNMAIFFTLFLIELIIGIYICYFKGVLLNDAFSRTANTFYVLFVKPRRLASIGLVWNPLPSFLQIPLVYFAKYWRPMASSCISAVIVDSFFAAITGYMLLKAFDKFNVKRKYSLIITLLYYSNPFIFFYGFNGMSETIFFAITIYIVINITLCIKEGAKTYITKIAFALGLLFFCRYEAIPFAIAVGIGIILIICFSEKEKAYLPNTGVKEHYFYIEGTGIVLYAPLLYAIVLWVGFNWIISGNPFYFLTSVYSNVSQSSLIKEASSLSGMLSYVINRSIPFVVVFLGIILLRIITKKLFKIDILILTILVFTLIVFHYLMLVKGDSYGWLRFFSYALPITVAWIPYEIYQTEIKYRKVTFLICSLTLVFSSFLCANALKNPMIANEEYKVTITEESKKIADHINENLSENKVMMDAFLTGGTILNVYNIDNLVVTSNLDFNECVNNPVKNKIEYILIPENIGIGKLDAINQKYPDLYNCGAEWCELYADFDNFKLYRIVD